jgi:plastin-1
VRWVNYHLKAAGSELSIKNFGPDVSDCEAYSILLNHLSPGTCPLLTEIDPPERSARILANAKAFGIEPFIGGKDITDGDRKLNLAFAAQLFRHRHGLVMPPRASAASAAAAAADEVRVQGMEEDAREGYVLGMWINALNIEGLHMKDFFEDCDSLTILKVIDSIQPGMVNWKK